MSERHSMRKIREVLRLTYECGRSQREIAETVNISHGSVGEYVKRARDAGLTWEIAEGLSDAEVEERLFQQIGRNEPSARAPVDFAWVHRELRRAGVTLQLLWMEYQEAASQGPGPVRTYQYSRFCELYEAYRKKLRPSMRQVHRAGERAFIDYSGKKPRIYDPKTGEAIEVELYVAVLGASNYTYATATLTQGLEDFVDATVRALEYFGCVSEILVPDQLRSAVRRPDWYEPEINRTFGDMGKHYGCAIIPARPRKPKDKAKAEVGVLVAQRWILARIRNQRFFSLEELNQAIAVLVEELNTRPFQKLEGTRRSNFEAIDRPAMRPLPACRYELARWRKAGVNIDYHIDYEGRFYSVPCELIGEKVEIRATARLIEVWRGDQRVACHMRSYGPKGTVTTLPEHRPRSHREFGEWPPERLIGWAAQTGPAAAKVVEAILTRGPHPECGRRSCLGLMRMAEVYGPQRLEAACCRALHIGNPTRKTVVAILKNGMDKVPLGSEPAAPVIVHENIRGGAYFDRGEGASEGDDEIESHYLEEERIAIMMEPARVQVEDAGVAQTPGPQATSGERLSQSAASGAPVAARPCPAVLASVEHARRALTRAPVWASRADEPTRQVDHEGDASTAPRAPGGMTTEAGDDTNTTECINQRVYH